ncbi:hypothetical protein T440DRAFT_142201 [Plenodomus tracheiphilus IPT5]|uniref:Uncharacterized protein n=1 Tax=Plenodomus tracheiphilus IPT5 TaxID=1408161 RepID=A0A6A7B3L3_9PLEO|nr:hypothetical protein T440DRAFT_142201 [Plenodomus tracheiphilus IPT5]
MGRFDNVHASPMPTHQSPEISQFEQIQDPSLSKLRMIPEDCVVVVSSISPCIQLPRMTPELIRIDRPSVVAYHSTHAPHLGDHHDHYVWISTLWSPGLYRRSLSNSRDNFLYPRRPGLFRAKIPGPIEIVAVPQMVTRHDVHRIVELPR